MKPSLTPSKLIPSLNGLRALSIFCVLIAHIQIINLRLPDGPGGQIGVNIFFVISGFLITLLLLKEEAATGTISLKGFFIRRSLRIFPVYYFMLLVYLILQFAGVFRIGLSSWLSSLTYTKYFFAQNQNDWETGHVWSLCVEEHFYLVWPCVFVYLKKFRHVFALAIVVLVPFVRLLTDVSPMHLFTRADALMWGCLFALYYKPLLRLITGLHYIVLATPFLLLLLCLLSKQLLPFGTSEMRNHFILAFAGSFGLITNICIGFIIIISINTPNNFYFNFINSRGMNHIGKLSYSIYLWQQFFFSENIGMLSHLPVNLLCIVVVSILSYRFVEKPFLKVKDWFSEKKIVLEAVAVKPKR